MGTTTSTSYSESSIYPITFNGRVFTVTRRSTNTMINELNPQTAATLHSVNFDSTNFTVLGDRVYFRDRTVTDFYGKRSGGGQLMVQDLQGGLAKELLPYGHEDNGGELLTAGNTLVSVLHDFDTGTAAIRSHDLITGEVTQVLYPGIPDGTFFSGSDGLYQLVQEGRTYWVNRYPLLGASQTLLEIELDAGEEGLIADQDKGKILLLAYGADFKVRSVLLHDIASNVTENVPIEEFGPAAGGLDYEFVVLD